MAVVEIPIGKRRMRSRALFGSPEVVSPIVGLGDFVVILAAGLIAYQLRFGTLWLSPSDGMTISVGLLTAMVVFNLFGVYHLERLMRPYRIVKKTLTAWVATLLVTTALVFATKTGDDHSRLWVGYWFLIGAAAIAGWRALMGALIQRAARQGALAEGLAIVASAEFTDLQRLIDRVRASSTTRLALRAVCVIGDNPPPTVAADVHLVNSVEGLAARAGFLGIERILVATGKDEAALWSNILAPLRHACVDIDLVTNGYNDEMCDRPLRSICGIPAVNIMRRPFNDAEVALKRIEDIVIAGLLLLFLAPVMGIIAAAVRLSSPGPVIFRQVRNGFGNMPFEVWKFRSMYQSDRAEIGVPQAVRNDPRVTPVGRFLRKSNLDELPQLINVLRGDMSLVGPRPHAVEHNEYYGDLVDDYLARHRVKPGITGWAQVNGWRGRTETVEDMANRIKCDLFYVDNWSILFDAKILFMTLFTFFHKNAY